MRHHVAIVGGGFGGLTAAQCLRRAQVQVTLVDRRNFHLFQPLLYQVATGGLSPANIATPLRFILRRQKNARVVLGEVVAVDAPNQRVILSDGELRYDTLVLATGARHHYFGSDHFEKYAPGLKRIEDAIEIRRRILTAFEAAERHDRPDDIERLLTFIVVGAGPTGLELAGTIAELARQTLPREFRHVDTSRARVLLIEGRDRVLPSYPCDLSRKAAAQLRRMGVSVRLHTLLENVEPNSVSLRSGDVVEEIPAHNVFWAAGVQASPLGILVSRATGAEVDRAGRLVVEPDCSLKDYANIFVIGDLANYSHQGSQPLPGTAPVAIQQGKFVARQICRQRKGLATESFRYKDRGQMATIGRSSAVCDLGWLRFGGFPAWLAWLLLHLVLLIGFQNRLLVLMQWGWNYFTRNRAARLITGGDAVLVEPRKDMEEMRGDSDASTSGFDGRFRS